MQKAALAAVLFILLTLPFFHPVQGATDTSVVLVTGFEPFNQWDSNPSEKIALALNDTMLGNTRVIGMVLPVTFDTSYLRLARAIEQHDPAAVIALGLDGSARSIEIEHMAVNLQHPDLWQLSRINVSAPMLRCTGLPATAIVEALHGEGIAARESWFAGLYVCNYVFYRLQGHAEQRGIKAGFIHVPPVPSQQPYGMELATMINAVRIAVNVTMAA